MKDLFHKLAQKVSAAVGSPVAFILAIATILGWGLSGPLFHFSDTWQLIINTSTTIVTFLMVFLIQNTQNRDARVMHLKLDELIRSSDPARNSLLDLEDLSDAEIEKLEKEFKSLRDQIQVIKEVKGKKARKGKHKPGKRPDGPDHGTGGPNPEDGSQTGESALGKSPLTTPGV